MLDKIFSWWSGATIGALFTIKKSAALVGEESRAVDDALAPTLAAPGALVLLEAFVRIQDPQIRRKLVDLVVALADGPVEHAPD